TVLGGKTCGVRQPSAALSEPASRQQEKRQRAGAVHTGEGWEPYYFAPCSIHARIRPISCWVRAGYLSRLSMGGISISSIASDAKSAMGLLSLLPGITAGSPLMPPLITPAAVSIRYLPLGRWPV